MNLFKWKYIGHTFVAAYAFLVYAYLFKLYSYIPYVFKSGSEWFWTMVQAIVVAITLLLIYFQLKAQHSKNMLDTVAVFDERWNSEKMRNSRMKLCKKYMDKDFENIYDLEGHVLDYFKQMGLYLKEGVYSRYVIWEFYSYYIKFYWAISEELIYKFRNDEEDNTYYHCFESLNNEMNKEDLHSKLLNRLMKNKLKSSSKTKSIAP